MINTIATGVNLAMFTLVVGLAALSTGAIIGFVMAAIIITGRDTDIAYEDGEGKQ